MSEAVVPPRALWVPFPLGRPLGAIGDPDFQKDVLKAAFDLLHTAVEPTIENYPNAAPDTATVEDWACPLNLGPASSGSLTDRLLAEIALLRPWAIETRRERGRTLFGVSGAEEDDIDELARCLAVVAETGDVTNKLYRRNQLGFRDATSATSYGGRPTNVYHEAIASQPSSNSPDHDALTLWIFNETVLGETLLSVADGLTDTSDSPMAQLVRGLLIPEGHYRGGSAFPAEVNFPTP